MSAELARRSYPYSLTSILAPPTSPLALVSDVVPPIAEARPWVTSLEVLSDIPVRDLLERVHSDGPTARWPANCRGLNKAVCKRELEGLPRLHADRVAASPSLTALLFVCISPRGLGHSVVRYGNWVWSAGNDTPPSRRIAIGDDGTLTEEDNVGRLAVVNPWIPLRGRSCYTKAELTLMSEAAGMVVPVSHTAPVIYGNLKNWLRPLPQQN